MSCGPIARKLVNMGFDVAVVGLGTAGAAVAAACAQRGLKVVGLERSSLDEAGAQWINGVPGWAFDEAGFARPEYPERLGENAQFHLVAGHGPSRVVIQNHGVMEVDMRALGNRLRALAQAQGAELRDNYRVLGFDGRTLQTEAGTIHASIYVDTSGYRGLSLVKHPFTQSRVTLCAAAQQVFTIKDLAAAEDFFASRGCQPGHVLCFTGVAGPYSILNLRIDGDHLSILTGSIPEQGYRSGIQILRDFVGQQNWVGQSLYGGSRVIPLGLPAPVLHQGRAVAIGDSASMVHAVHGSGIGQQLLAARLLADTLADGGSLDSFNYQWQRKYAGLLAGADCFRRFSQTLLPSEFLALVEEGVLRSEVMVDVLGQKRPRPPASAILGSARGLRRMPKVASRLAPTLAKLGAMELHHRRYPQRLSQVSRWRAVRDGLAYF